MLLIACPLGASAAQERPPIAPAGDPPASQPGEEARAALVTEAFRLLDEGKQRKNAFDYSGAAERFRACVDAFDRASSAENAAWASGWLGEAYRGMKDGERAATAFADAVRRFAALNHDLGLAINSSNLASCYYGLERYADAAPHYMAAAAAYDRLKDHEQAALMHGSLGDTYQALKDDERAVGSYREAVRRFAELKVDESLAMHSERLGEALYRLKRFADAVSPFEAAAAAYDRVYLPLEAAGAQGRVGEAYEALGDDERAARAYELSVKQFVKQKNDAGIARHSGNQALALFRLKRFADALPLFEQAERAYERLKDPVNAAWSHSWRGDTLVAMKDDEKAAVVYQETVGLFTALNHDRGLSTSAYALGATLYRLKRYAEAVPSFESAAQAYERQGRAEDVAWATEWIGDCFREVKDDERAVAEYEKARAQFAALKLDARVARECRELGYATYRLRRFPDALSHFADAAAAYELAKNQVDAAWMFMWRGFTRREEGKDELGLPEYAEALRRFSELKDESGIGEAYFHTGAALYRLKRYAEAVAPFETAASAFERAGQPADVASSYSWLGDAYRDQGDDGRAARAYETAIQRQATVDDAATLASYHLKLGKTHYRLQRYALAITSFDAAAAAYERAERPLEIAWMWSWKGDTHRAANEGPQAVAAYEESTRRFAALKDDEGLAMDAESLGRLLYRLGRFADAVPHLATAAAAYERREKPTDAAWMHTWQGNAHREMNDYKAAAAAYSEAVRRFTELKDDTGQSAVGSDLARALNRLGQYDEAGRQFELAAAAYERKGEPDQAAWMYSWRADVYRDIGDRATAARAYSESVRRFRQLNLMSGVAIDSFELGAALYHLRCYAQAIPAFEESVAAYEASGRPHMAAVVTAWIGDTCLRVKDDESAARYYLDGARRFGALGDDASEGIYLSAAAKRLYQLNLLIRATPLFERAAEAFEQAGRADDVAWMHGWLGDVWIGRYEHERAASAYEESARRFEELKNPTGLAINGGRCGQALFRLRRFTDALEQFVRAAGAYEQVENGVQAAWMHSWQADCLEAQGRYARALGLREECVRRMRAAFGPDVDHFNLADTLDEYGRCLRHLGKPAEAQKQHEEALAMRQRLVQNRDDEAVARSLSELANCLLELNDPQTRDESLSKALALFNRALGIYQRLYPDQDHPKVAAALESLARCYRRQGKTNDAKLNYERSRDIYLRLYPGGDSADLVRCLDNMAMCVQEQGNQNHAIDLFTKAIEYSVKFGFPDTADLMAHLAKLHFDAAQYRDSEPWLRKAIDQIERFREEAKTLTPADRAAYFERLKQSGVYELMIEAQLALADEARQAGQAREAAECDNQALAYLERSRGRSLLDLLEGGRLNIAVRAHTLAAGDPKKKKELEDLEALLEEANERVAALDHRLATHAGAPRGADQQPPPETDELRAQQQAARREQQLLAQRCQDLYARILGDMFQLGAPATPDELRKLPGQDELLVYYMLDDGRSRIVLVDGNGLRRTQLLTWPDGTPVTDDSLDAAVTRYRSGLTAQGHLLQRANRQEKLNQARGAGGAAQVAELEREIAELEEAANRSLSRDDVVSGNLEDYLAEGERLFAALAPPEIWRELAACERVYLIPHGALNKLPLETLVVTRDANAAGQTPTYWLDVGPEIVYGPSAKVLLLERERRQTQLSRATDRGNTAMLTALLLGNPIFESRPPVDYPERGALVLDVPSGSLGAQLKLMPQDVITKYDGEDVSDGLALSERLTAIRREQRDGLRDKRRVPLVFWRPTDDSTHEQLVVSGTDLNVELADAAPREHLALTRPAPEDGPEVAMASPTRAADTRAGALRPLPGTRQEVLDIFQALTGDAYDERSPAAADQSTVRVLMREAATETAFFELAKSARFIHLATHGLADVGDGYGFSGVALTLPRNATQADNGFLELSELLFDQRWQDRLVGCELAVLSACDTQVGREQRDEAVYALPLGFHSSGTPSVIASLWQVSDDSTAKLMAAFYQLLTPPGARGPGDKLTAFTAARRKIRENAEYAAPFFWAPFIYIGDPR